MKVYKRWWRVREKNPVLEFLNNLWGLGTEYEKGCRTGTSGTQPGGIGSLEPILGLLKSLKIRALLGWERRGGVVWKGGSLDPWMIPMYACVCVMRLMISSDHKCYNNHNLRQLCSTAFLVSGKQHHPPPLPPPSSSMMYPFLSFSPLSFAKKHVQYISPPLVILW